MARQEGSGLAWYHYALAILYFLITAISSQPYSSYAGLLGGLTGSFILVYVLTAGWRKWRNPKPDASTASAADAA